MGLRLAVETALSRWGDPVRRLLLPSRPSRPAVVCLIFHAVTERPRFKIDVDPAQLSRMLDTLRQEGTPILALEDAVAALRSGELERSTVVLTFDDGYKDFRELAAPILREYGAPATVSIVPHFVESQEPFDFETGHGRYSMSWEEIDRLLDTFGDLVTVANHSWAHRDFTTRTADEIHADVARSQEAIASRLGAAPAVFTFPFGASNGRSERIVGETFDIVLGGGWGRNYPGAAAAPLSRFAVFAHDGGATRVLKARGAMTCYQAVRDIARPLSRLVRRR